MTIAAALGLKAVTPWKSSKVVDLGASDPALLYGLELEIEGLAGRDVEGMYVPGMSGTQDGSLRNGGWEFITKPASYSNIALILETFFNKNKLTPDNYSERCSVHVHCNVQDFEMPQLKALALLYQVFEGLLYAFVGEDRDKSIFCVPWSQTNITYQTIARMDETNPSHCLHGWQKYTGLNLLPIQEQGSVEFRQMPGTCDVKQILNWLQLIGCLFAYARRMPFDAIQKQVMEVNTNSQYRGILFEVFGQHAPLLMSITWEQLLEEGVLNTKYMLASSYKKAAPPTVVFDDAWVAQHGEALAALDVRPFVPAAPDRFWAAGQFVNPAAVFNAVREERLLREADRAVAVARTHNNLRPR